MYITNSVYVVGKGKSKKEIDPGTEVNDLKMIGIDKTIAGRHIKLGLLLKKGKEVTKPAPETDIALAKENEDLRKQLEEAQALIDAANGSLELPVQNKSSQANQS